MNKEKDYFSPASVFTVIAGGLFAFAVIFSIITAHDGANIGAGFIAFIGLMFALLAAHYRNQGPSEPDE